MSDKTKIEWCDATWNPVVGCSPVSEGCSNCYARRMVGRFPHLTGESIYDGYSVGWDGRAHFMPHKLEQPLHWRKPKKIFVCSMSDLFHASVTNEQIAAVFGVMADCPQHTFMVLTKRPSRALEWFRWFLRKGCGDLHKRLEVRDDFTVIWPLPNVWIGVSVENQETADDRIPTLLKIPAAKRFVSVEPMLGQVELDDLVVGTEDGLEHHIDSLWCEEPNEDCGQFGTNVLDWVICGAETGTGKRPMDLDWARSLRDQCRAASVPFFFKRDSNGNKTLFGGIYEAWPK